jgi:hypothetical protein
MKIILSLAILLLFTSTKAQDITSTDSTLRITDTDKLGKPDNTNIKDRTIYDTSIDNRPHSKYGNLLNDDPLYNPKYAW